VADDAALSELRARLNQIETAVDDGAYRSGPWARLARDLKRSPEVERRALAADVSRISRKLHLRAGRRTIPVAAGIALEAAGVIAGGVLLAAAIHGHSPIAAIAGAIFWVTAFQPLFKIAVGYALGVGYEYTYLYGAEPRFKMRFGDYLAAPRWARVALHLGGTVGSPLGLWCAAIAIRDELPGTARVFVAAMWMLVALNAVFFAIGATGAARVGSHRVGDTSGGAAALEIREALGL
jgi:hypothetical protein